MLSRKKIQKLVGCSNPSITVTLKKVLAQHEKGISDNDLNLTSQQHQIYEILQFEDKFLNEVFPDALHIKMCVLAAKKSTVKESFIKEHALRCKKFSEFLIRKKEQKEEGLTAVIKKIQAPSTLRSMIEILEYDDDFAFDLCIQREYIDNSGRILQADKIAKMRKESYSEVYPYQELCSKAMSASKDETLYDFAHDCLELSKLIIARGVRE